MDSRTRVLICDSVDKELLQGLQSQGYQVRYKPEITHEELVQEIGDYNVVVVRSRTKINSSVLDAANNLKYIARAGIGTDNIDLIKAEEKGIKILTAAGASTQSVVELNLALAIVLSRNIVPLNIEMREGNYKKKKGLEVGGSTCGIIGFGRIGYETAKVLSSIGAGIVAYDIVRNDDLISAVAGEYIELDDLLSRSDYIFICVTLNGNSRKLIGKEEFEKVKDGSYIVNTSRAEAIDGNYLVEALKSGKLGGYAADVMWNEPPKEEWERELIKMDNVIITPHIGAQTEQGQKRVAYATLENIKRAVGGGN